MLRTIQIILFSAVVIFSTTTTRGETPIASSTFSCQDFLNGIAAEDCALAEKIALSPNDYSIECEALQLEFAADRLLTCLMVGYTKAPSDEIFAGLPSFNLSASFLQFGSCQDYLRAAYRLAVKASGFVDVAPQPSNEICHALFVLAQNRGPMVPWLECGGTSSTVNPFIACSTDLPGTPSFESRWLQALWVCKTAGEPTVAAKEIETNAKKSGRNLPPLTCETVYDVALEYGLATAQQISDATAGREAALGQAKLTAEAQLAATRRQAEALEVVIAGRIREIDSIAFPERLIGAARPLLARNPLDFSADSYLFAGGLVAKIFERCQVSLPSSDRRVLASLVTSTALRVAVGGEFSASNISTTSADQLGSLGIFVLASRFADELPCSSSSTNALVEHIAYLLAKSRSTSAFLNTCKPAHGEEACDCLGAIAQSIYPNIYHEEYDRGMIPGLIRRNPIIGMQVAAQCGIFQY